MDTHTQGISTVVIAAAGKGTRMGIFTSIHPKCLVPLLGKPMLQYAIEGLHAAGFQRIIVVVEHFAEQVQALAKQFPYPVECVQQSSVVGNRYGTAAVVQAVMPLITHTPIVLYSGDSLFHASVFTRLFSSLPRPTLCAAQAVSVLGYGEVVIDADHRLTHLQEKPVVDQAGLINTGLYVLTPDMYPMIESLTQSVRGEYELTDAIAQFAVTHPVHVELIEGHEWTTVTREADIFYAEQYVQRS